MQNKMDDAGFTEVVSWSTSKSCVESLVGVTHRQRHRSAQELQWRHHLGVRRPGFILTHLKMACI